MAVGPVDRPQPDATADEGLRRPLAAVARPPVGRTAAATRQQQRPDPSSCRPPCAGIGCTGRPGRTRGGRGELSKSLPSASWWLLGSRWRRLWPRGPRRRAERASREAGRRPALVSTQTLVAQRDVGLLRRHQGPPGSMEQVLCARGATSEPSERRRSRRRYTSTDSNTVNRAVATPCSSGQRSSCHFG